MKRFFSTFALLMGAVAFSTGTAFAVSVCSTAVVDVTTLNAGGGCTVGTLTFNTFTVSAGQVGITGINNPGVSGVGLNFNPNLTDASVLNDIHFSFSVTGPISSLSLVYAFDGATGTGTSAIGEKICDSVGVNASGLCLGTQLATLNTATNIIGTPASGTVSFAPQTTIFIWKDINITGNDHLSSFDQNFSSTTAPEPATLSMLGLGLVGLGIAARKRMKR
ncbi:MAG: PEP-CTERM sorting domain-containing protein [Acidobacteriota bacterium]